MFDEEFREQLIEEMDNWAQMRGVQIIKLEEEEEEETIEENLDPEITKEEDPEILDKSIEVVGRSVVKPGSVEVYSVVGKNISEDEIVDIQWEVSGEDFRVPNINNGLRVLWGGVHKQYPFISASIELEGRTYTSKIQISITDQEEVVEEVKEEVIQTELKLTLTGSSNVKEHSVCEYKMDFSGFSLEDIENIKSHISGENDSVIDGDVIRVVWGDSFKLSPFVQASIEVFGRTLFSNKINVSIYSDSKPEDKVEEVSEPIPTSPIQPTTNPTQPQNETSFESREKSIKDEWNDLGRAGFIYENAWFKRIDSLNPFPGKAVFNFYGNSHGYNPPPPNPRENGSHFKTYTDKYILVQFPTHSIAYLDEVEERPKCWYIVREKATRKVVLEVLNSKGSTGYESDTNNNHPNDGSLWFERGIYEIEYHNGCKKMTQSVRFGTSKYENRAKYFFQNVPPGGKVVFDVNLFENVEDGQYYSGKMNCNIYKGGIPGDN